MNCRAVLQRLKLSIDARASPWPLRKEDLPRASILT